MILKGNSTNQQRENKFMMNRNIPFDLLEAIFDLVSTSPALGDFLIARSLLTLR